MTAANARDAIQQMTDQLRDEFADREPPVRFVVGDDAYLAPDGTVTVVVRCGGVQKPVCVYPPFDDARILFAAVCIAAEADRLYRTYNQNMYGN